MSAAYCSKKFLDFEVYWLYQKSAFMTERNWSTFSVSKPVYSASMCVSLRYLLNVYFLTHQVLCGWMPGCSHSESTQSAYSVLLEHVQVFMIHVLLLLHFQYSWSCDFYCNHGNRKWQMAELQKRLKLGVRLNDSTGSLHGKKGGGVELQCQWKDWSAFACCVILLFKD